MAQPTSERVFRVTVRGRFHELTDAARRQLVAARAEHDIFRSAYTTEGTLTYDQAIDFFNLRYEVRIDAATGDASNAAEEAGVREASAFLRTMRFGARDLRAEVVDMSAMWEGVRHRRG